MSDPTIEDMVKLYLESAKIEQLKLGKPCDNTQRNTIAGTRRFLAWMANPTFHVRMKNLRIS